MTLPNLVHPSPDNLPHFVILIMNLVMSFSNKAFIRRSSSQQSYGVNTISRPPSFAMTLVTQTSTPLNPRHSIAHGVPWHPVQDRGDMSFLWLSQNQSLKDGCFHFIQSFLCRVSGTLRSNITIPGNNDSPKDLYSNACGFCLFLYVWKDSGVTQSPQAQASMLVRSGGQAR